MKKNKVLTWGEQRALDKYYDYIRAVKAGLLPEHTLQSEEFKELAEQVKQINDERSKDKY